MTLSEIQPATKPVDTRRMRIRNHPPKGQIIAAAILGLIVILLVRSLANNTNLDWPAVGKYLFHPAIMKGVAVTIELTALGMVEALVLGFTAAYAMQSQNRVAKAIGHFYLWFFRGTPILVQLLFWFNLSLLFPQIRISLPITGELFSWETNQIMTGFIAAVLGLGVHEGAYMAEIFRGGILSVPKGQWEAGLSMGLKKSKVLRAIIIPQSIRVIIPPTGNQFITLLKGTSLVSVIGGGELLTRTQMLYSATYEVIPLLVVACIWYLVLVSVSSFGQHFLEKRYDHG